MTTADHNHPEIEHILERQTELIERHSRNFEQLIDFAKETNAILRDLALAIVRVEGHLDRIDIRLSGIDMRLNGVDIRLGTIEDALRRPGHN